MMLPINKHRPEQAATCDLVIYCGRGSALGNPFPITADNDRTTVIGLYTDWLLERVQSRDPAIMDALRSIHQHHWQGKVVGLQCFCAPLPCHTSVIISTIHRLWPEA